jgi:tetratricopeptide (TPR) repeat protein
VSSVFISYRRDDSRDIAERICDHLTSRFGDRHVFQDVVDIAPGLAWDQAIDVAIESSDTVLVIIGDNWLTAAKDGVRRLDDPTDELREEIVRALAKPDTRVIPVLVGTAAMPTATDLPTALQGLVKRQAWTIRGGEHFHADISALADAIAPRRINRRWVLPAVGAVAALGLVVLTAVLITRPDGGKRESSTTTPTPTAPITAADVTTTISNGEITIAPVPSTTTAPVDANTAGYRTDPLTGTFNIAVLGFVADPADDRPAALEATNSENDLVRYLNDQLSVVGNGGPSTPQVDVGLFAPAAPGSPEAADVQLLADRLNADVVVTASLRSTSPSGSSFAPTFAVRTDTTSRLLQLAGTYGLGSAITFQRGFDEPAVKGEVRTALKRRSCVLVHLVLGLSYYREHNDDNARESFEQAVAADGCAAAGAGSPSGSGQEIADLYLGSLAMLAGDLPGADQWYDRALAVDPRFARAMFGKAEVAFQRSRATTCDGATDVGALHASLAAYDDAFAAYRSGLQSGQPQIPYLATQAHLQTGRAQLCLGLIEPASVDLAAVNLNQVVTDYLEAPPERQAQLADLASEAYAGLAYVEMTKAVGSDPEAALAQLDRALALGPEPARSVVIRSLRALINERLGRTADAAQDCAGVTDVSDQPCPLLNVTNFLLPYTAPLRLALTGPTAATLLLMLGGLLSMSGAALLLLAGTNRRRSSA